MRVIWPGKSMRCTGTSTWTLNFEREGRGSGHGWLQSTCCDIRKAGWKAWVRRQVEEGTRRAAKLLPILGIVHAWTLAGTKVAGPGGKWP